MWPDSNATEAAARVYGASATSAAAAGTAAAQATRGKEAVMFEQLKLIGKACESLDNRPFVCRTLVAYKRLNRPTQGNDWAKNLILRMNGR